MHLENGIFAGFENTVEAAQHNEGQDYLAIFGLLEIPAQRFGDLPDEIRECFRLLYGLVVHSGSRNTDATPAPLNRIKSPPTRREEADIVLINLFG